MPTTISMRIAQMPRRRLLTALLAEDLVDAAAVQVRVAEVPVDRALQ